MKGDADAITMHLADEPLSDRAVKLAITAQKNPPTFKGRSGSSGLGTADTLFSHGPGHLPVFSWVR